MSAATLNTPAGKLRTQTTRRYVLVRWREGQPPRVFKRSDSIETLRAYRRLQGFESAVRFAIFDTVTKEQIQ